MNDQALAQLAALLASRASHGARLLQEQCNDRDFRGELSHGSWSNNAGVTVAYISCFLDRDLSKEAIDMTWQMSLDQGVVVLQGDIGYSNGQVIKPIIDLTIDLTAADDILFTVQAMLDESLAEALIQLKNILGCHATEDD